MDRLSSDLLLSILGGLDSKEMCKCRRVSKRWSEIIDGSKSNWRELIVSDKIQDWKPSILNEFDQKSGSSIRAVDIKIGTLPTQPKVLFLKTLYKSSKSLSTLFISSGDFWVQTCLSLKSEGPLPNLTDLRLVDTTAHPHDNVQLIKRDKVEFGKLRILGVDILYSTNLEILSHLTSLSIQQPKRQEEFRQILEAPSQTLRHLQIGFVDSESAIKPLHFPRLELLELLRCLHGFPSWFKIPSTSKLISRSIEVPLQLPNCSELWLGGILGYPNLENRVPS